jgi:hypothetical protein
VAVSKRYDKFDDRNIFSTSKHLINNHSNYQGVYWCIFTYMVDPKKESGFLTFLRAGEGWLWNTGVRAVVIAGDTRVDSEEGQSVRDNGLIDTDPHTKDLPGMREAFELELTREECLALASAPSPIEGKVGHVQFSFGKGFMEDIAQAVAQKES